MVKSRQEVIQHYESEVKKLEDCLLTHTYERPDLIRHRIEVLKKEVELLKNR